MSHGLWGDASRRLLRDGPALVGLGLIAVFLVSAIAAPWLTPYDPYRGVLADRLQPPTLAHLMGTDLQGRDELTRVLYGARISLQVGVSAVVMALVLGGVAGALAGGFGGWIDAVVMRVTDVMLAVPGILLAIAIVAWLGQGLPQLMIAIAASYTPTFARLLRGSLLVLRESDYVTAARSEGATTWRILLRHMLPNALTPLIVQATLVLATAIIDIAGLGFLGLGPQDPSTPEWGTMLTDATQRIYSTPWLVLFPGVAIATAAIGFNLLGDGLRESLDPRLKR